MFKNIKVYSILLAAGTLLTLALPPVAQAENSGGTTTSFGYATSSSTRDVTDADIIIDSDVYNSSGNISNVYGGYAYGNGGDSMNNKVTVLGGKMTQAIGGNNNTASGSAIGNTLTFQGGTSTATGTTSGVMGGRSTNGHATGNTLVFHAGSASSVEGIIAGGYAPGAGGHANNNTLILSGGQQSYKAVGGIMHGGWAGTGAGSGNANNNSIIILDGYYANNIYVGRTSNGDATGNTLTLAGNGITLDGQVFGGGPTSGTGDKYTGNALNVFSSGNTISGNMSNFQQYNFAFPTDGAVSLTYSGTALDFGTAGSSMVSYVLPGKTLAPGTTATLLQTTNPFTGTLSLTNGQAQQGIARMYDYTMDKTADTITATITGVKANPKTASLSQGQAAAFAPVSMGADLVAATGMENARAAANAATGANGGSVGGSGGSGLVPFMALTGSFMRHNVGAGVNINGGAVMAGLGKKWSLSAADVLLGAFFDASMSRYTANKNFGSSGSMEGTGDVTTVGGGLLARVDVTDTAARGLYAEASLRIGSLYNKYKNEDLRDMAGNTADYDLASTYYSAHAGIGYIWAISQTANLDLYAKYFWSSQSGSSVDIAGDPFTFDPINSSRVRLGGRFSFGLSEQVAPYIGAAWECEMDGVARATTYGFEVPTASTQGSTGMGELGLSFKPAADPQLSVDLGVQGFIGMREGVSGNVMIKYEF